MSSSFLGSRVSVQLQHGGEVQGTITAIDPATGSLSVQRDIDAANVTVKRADIADLRMLQAAPPVAAAATTSARINSPKPAPRSKEPSSGQASSGSATTRNKAFAKAAQHGRLPRTRTPDVKPKQQAARTLADADSDLEEDFDFDKALRAFDKKKVWDEIKTTDHSDPRMLLVSHNRIADSEANGFGHGRGQQKLAWDEPVLSPSPPPTAKASVNAEPVAATAATASTFDIRDVELELNRVRGNTLLRDIELGRLRDELLALKAKASLLESLSGVEVEPATPGNTDKWHVTLYDSLASHVEARREAASGKPSKRGGAMTFAASTADEGKLRYLGPVAQKSDPAVVERLPSQYRGEMGLKRETASLFLRRIKDAVQPAT